MVAVGFWSSFCWRYGVSLDSFVAAFVSRYGVSFTYFSALKIRWMGFGPSLEILDRLVRISLWFGVASEVKIVVWLWSGLVVVARDEVCGGLIDWWFRWSFTREIRGGLD
ncbi:unnamed protein product [Arabis nemorensis]|uniref:Uncharacterized protein n=1 Tax=Arabis nemorensis TaxID=586526 RepID=A0A565B9T2_9BRAS|nr:unnamed protein product [Arabis nemorensis]